MADAAPTCDRRHGPVVGGRYRLEQVLRSGPDRCEHRAHDDLLHRAVTTVIAAPTDGGPVPEAVTLPISARLPHGPGLPEVYDGGGADGVLYLVVPSIEGTRLSDDLAAGPLPVADVCALGVAIARVLLPLHRHGCVHGALGAEHVMRGPGGVTVAGLGVEEWLHRWAHHRCHPPHPAPEQRGPAPSVSPATDVYALGRLLGAAAGRQRRRRPLRAVLAAMTAADPGSRPSTGQVIALLDGAARPGSSSRLLAGTLTTATLAGALALGGLVAHTVGSAAGLPAGARLGAPVPSRIAAVPLAGLPGVSGVRPSRAASAQRAALVVTSTPTAPRTGGRSSSVAPPRATAAATGTEPTRLGQPTERATTTERATGRTTATTRTTRPAPTTEQPAGQTSEPPTTKPPTTRPPTTKPPTTKPPTPKPPTSVPKTTKPPTSVPKTPVPKTTAPAPTTGRATGRRTASSPGVVGRRTTTPTTRGARPSVTATPRPTTEPEPDADAADSAAG